MTNEQKYLRAHFLEPETRCGTEITVATKKHWKVMLDMLEIVLDICKRENLTVWMAAGSVLGAVRHQGIIPWDDDIDVMMPRKDYNRFCKIAPKLLPPEYSAKTRFSDPAILDLFLKIRKRGTTAIMPSFADSHIKYDSSIFLDVFPLDRKPVNARVLERLLRCSLHVEKLNNYYRSFVGRTRLLDLLSFRWLMHWLVATLYRLFGPVLNKVCDNLFLYLSRFNRQVSAFLCMCPRNYYIWSSHSLESFARWTYPVEIFNETRYVPFEYLMVPIPSGFEQLLTISYGDWRKFVRGTSFHSTLIVDTERDYKDVLKQRFGYTDDEFRNAKWT